MRTTRALLVGEPLDSPRLCRPRKKVPCGQKLLLTPPQRLPNQCFVSSKHCVQAILLAGLIGVGTGCAGMLPASNSYDYFARPATTDAWSPKIGSWQRRARADRRLAPTLTAAPLAVLVPEVAVANTTQTRPSPLAPKPLSLVEPDPMAAQPNQPPVPEALALNEPTQGAQPTAAAPVSELGSDLRSKYLAFRSERRRAMAEELFAWIQRQSREHYVSDGPLDHWATLEETLERNGDDCDGLELLVYNALLSMGFKRSEVFRAVVYRPSDLQHHMVTLWFEDPKDPWVIDPTGAMTDRMRRMSDLSDWVPLKMFGTNSEFSVTRLRYGSRDLVGSVAQN